MAFDFRPRVRSLDSLDGYLVRLGDKSVPKLRPGLCFSYCHVRRGCPPGPWTKQISATMSSLYSGCHTTVISLVLIVGNSFFFCDGSDFGKLAGPKSK